MGRTSTTAKRATPSHIGFLKTGTCRRVRAGEYDGARRITVVAISCRIPQIPFAGDTAISAPICSLLAATTETATFALESGA